MTCSASKRRASSSFSPSSTLPSLAEDPKSAQGWIVDGEEYEGLMEQLDRAGRVILVLGDPSPSTLELLISQTPASSLILLPSPASQTSVARPSATRRLSLKRLRSRSSVPAAAPSSSPNFAYPPTPSNVVYLQKSMSAQGGIQAVVEEAIGIVARWRGKKSSQDKKNKRASVQKSKAEGKAPANSQRFSMGKAAPSVSSLHTTISDDNRPTTPSDEDRNKSNRPSYPKRPFDIVLHFLPTPSLVSSNLQELLSTCFLVTTVALPLLAAPSKGGVAPLSSSTPNSRRNSSSDLSRPASPKPTSIGLRPPTSASASSNLSRPSIVASPSFLGPTSSDVDLFSSRVTTRPPSIAPSTRSSVFTDTRPFSSASPLLAHIIPPSPSPKPASSSVSSPLRPSGSKSVLSYTAAVSPQRPPSTPLSTSLILLPMLLDKFLTPFHVTYPTVTFLTLGSSSCLAESPPLPADESEEEEDSLTPTPTPSLPSLLTLILAGALKPPLPPIKRGAHSRRPSNSSSINGGPPASASSQSQSFSGSPSASSSFSNSLSSAATALPANYRTFLPSTASVTFIPSTFPLSRQPLPPFAYSYSSVSSSPSSINSLPLPLMQEQASSSIPPVPPIPAILPPLLTLTPTSPPPPPTSTPTFDTSTLKSSHPVTPSPLSSPTESTPSTYDLNSPIPTKGTSACPSPVPTAIPALDISDSLSSDSTTSSSVAATPRASSPSTPTLPGPGPSSTTMTGKSQNVEKRRSWFGKMMDGLSSSGKKDKGKEKAK